MGGVVASWCSVLEGGEDRGNAASDVDPLAANLFYGSKCLIQCSIFHNGVEVGVRQD